MLGRWYTRKSELAKPIKQKDAPCFCQENNDEQTVKCENINCPISLYHPSCLKMTEFPKRWMCPHCHKLPKEKNSHQKKSKENLAAKAALDLDKICVCAQKPTESDILIQCHNSSCKNGKYFHLACLGYKRRPNNHQTTWQCYQCQGKSKPCSKTNFDQEIAQLENINFDENSNAFDISDEVEITLETSGEAERFAPMAQLCDSHFSLIESKDGWLDCDIIQAAHCIMQQVNPLIEGFQRPTLGPARNFAIVTGEFIQILYTGNSHWVCTSSIGCVPGTVNLYDSLYMNVIHNEVVEQVENLVGEDVFEELNLVPVQQQNNGSDCGVFAIAYATSLLYGTPPETIEYDISRMRHHLYQCLKSGELGPFPSV